MLADAARKGEAARAQRREKMILAEKEHVTSLVRVFTFALSCFSRTAQNYG